MTTTELAPENTPSVFDRVVSAGLWLPAEVVDYAAGNTAEEAGQTKILQQTRIGQHGEPFEIYKLRTEDGETGTPFNDTFAKMRQIGADELVQRENLKNGTMAFQGWRPLIPKEHVEFLDSLPPGLRDRWLKVVLPTLPGMISTYGFEYHVGLHSRSDKFGIKAEMDISDALESGARLAMRLVRKLVSSAVTNRLHPL